MVRVEWTAAGARIAAVTNPVSDVEFLGAVETADHIGVDVPFGWPAAFVGFVTAQHGDEQPAVLQDAAEWRRSLAYRTTDRWVATEFGKWPLSVSTDRIALPAMRAAALLAALRERGTPVDRAGGGRIAEVYPGVALRVWGLAAGRYKGASSSGSPALLHRLQAAAPWLDLAGHAPALSQNDDVFDALVCALIARAHALGRWHRPPATQLEQISREGWIVVPDCTLAELVS